MRILVALVVGVIVGGALNMALILGGSAVIPAPEGVDVTNADSIAAAIDQFQPRHFAFPFLAHAAGTLAGALTGHVLAPTHRNQIALGIGALFLIGGIVNATMIPAPEWFLVLDLVLAYLPMAWLATRIGLHLKSAS